jgi:RNA polymerase sigma-70 factor (ECF subfamily)
MIRDVVTSEGFSLEALRAGDRAEFARFVESYSGIVYRLALKILNNPQDAEDVLQETFIKAFRHLYRIATNEALMVLRRRKINPLSIDEPDDSAQGEQEPMQIIDWCCLPEGEMMSTEARKYMDNAVNQLPHSLRVVFLLREIEGLSTRETADVLNLSETAVKTRLSRARLRLRELLTEYFGEILSKQAPVKGVRQE